MIVYAIKNCNQYVCTSPIGFIELSQRCLTFNISEACLFNNKQEADEKIEYLRAIDRSPFSRYSIVKFEIKEVKEGSK